MDETLNVPQQPTTATSDPDTWVDQHGAYLYRYGLAQLGASNVAGVGGLAGTAVMTAMMSLIALMIGPRMKVMPLASNFWVEYCCISPWEAFMRSVRLLGLLGLLLTALTLQAQEGKRRDGDLKEGAAAPDFSIRDVEGKKGVKLSDLRGKPVVLIFGSCT